MSQAVRGLGIGISWKAKTMTTNFTANGINYIIQMRGQSLAEREQIALNIKPDPTIWKTVGRRGHGVLNDAKIPKAHPDRRRYKK